MAPGDVVEGKTGMFQSVRSLKGGGAEKDLTGFAVLSTPRFPLRGEVPNHKGIFDERAPASWDAGAFFVFEEKGLQTDLFVSEVAGGVLGPFVAVVGFGAGAEVAAADVQEAALGTAAAHMGLLVLELVQQLDVGVVPDLGEGALQHVAEGVVAPELVGMHLAVPGDAADAAAGVVALVVLQSSKISSARLGSSRFMRIHT